MAQWTLLFLAGGNCNTVILSVVDFRDGFRDGCGCSRGKDFPASEEKTSKKAHKGIVHKGIFPNLEFPRNA
eukprot:3762475-Amphidinium_carterae.1